MTMTRQEALDVKVKPMEFAVMILNEGDFPSHENLPSEIFLEEAERRGLARKDTDSEGLEWWQLTAAGVLLLESLPPETREAHALISADHPRPEWAIRA